MIDLRSDTLTMPTPEMREYMIHAQVGDDCYGEDISVNQLESYCKELFQVEDALFVPTGTMSNQLAIKSQVQEGNEVLTDLNYHISFYESGPTALLSRTVLHTKQTADGILNIDDLVQMIEAKPRGSLYAQPQLVTIENTIANFQGKLFPLNQIRELYEFTRTHRLSFHMDGARLFNAHIATQIPLHEYAKYVDSLSICFAKGLAAPFGSMLMGKKSVIDQAKKYRKQFGGGLHQIGMYAAAAHYALQHHLKGIEKDHQLTKLLARHLCMIPEFNIQLNEIETNMIFLDLSALGVTSEQFISLCQECGLLLFPLFRHIARIVVHRNISQVDINRAATMIDRVVKKIRKRQLHNPVIR